ncbi:hypothetical protein D3H64_04745 [Atopobacter sp. AH10]|uniref:hypothetical protein n=1 Tax=Atopobacter sp. AH10 TaxID=2315861 RepID=UPI000EF1963D|nr:hypothetical protein [Atopobacter sp. AH10]RLK63401.1 hypothetical protein D3H64_04745 [Atopobacter sp. AH10]
MRPKALKQLNTCLEKIQSAHLKKEEYTSLYAELLNTYVQRFDPLWISQFPKDPGADAGLIEKILASYPYGKAPVRHLNRLDRQHYKGRLHPGSYNSQTL